ncbi:hypothetical protein M0R45_026608 [Rubus argutus]|uniref:RNase H type-1 domain-containing protein n=1 Tax=Rubus argutus TaxID=59490 RepID=A0AAW1WXY3_RUBAR
MVLYETHFLMPLSSLSCTVLHLLVSKFCFNGELTSTFRAQRGITPRPLLIIDTAIKEWSSARISTQNQNNYCLNLLAWKKPPQATMKLNIDGSRNGQNGKIAAGGVLRNSQGHWISGFPSQSCNDLHPLGSLLACCKKLIQTFTSISIVHIYRECNMVADALAKNGINHDHGAIFLDNPPYYASHAYSDDLEDTIHTRRFLIAILASFWSFAFVFLFVRPF